MEKPVLLMTISLSAVRITIVLTEKVEAKTQKARKQRMILSKHLTWRGHGIRILGSHFLNAFQAAGILYPLLIAEAIPITYVSYQRVQVKRR